MLTNLPLAPRYRLDDESTWLMGVDPLRRYWFKVNGVAEAVTGLQGLPSCSKAELKPLIMAFRELQPGQDLHLGQGNVAPVAIHCISRNCYAVADQLHGAAVWHLFDQESLESLLMTAHPDWQCAPEHVELGRQLLAQSMGSAIAA